MSNSISNIRNIPILILNANHGNNTPLHLAIINEQIERIRILIENNRTYINAANEDGNTPLHLAAAAGQIEIVRLLIENGANTQMFNNFNMTPFLKARANGHREVVLLLEPNNNPPRLNISRMYITNDIVDGDEPIRIGFLDEIDNI